MRNRERERDGNNSVPNESCSNNNKWTMCFFLLGCVFTCVWLFIVNHDHQLLISFQSIFRDSILQDSIIYGEYTCAVGASAFTHHMRHRLPYDSACVFWPCNIFIFVWPNNRRRYMFLQLRGPLSELVHACESIWPGNTLVHDHELYGDGRWRWWSLRIHQPRANEPWPFLFRPQQNIHVWKKKKLILYRYFRAWSPYVCVTNR